MHSQHLCLSARAALPAALFTILQIHVQQLCILLLVCAGINRLMPSPAMVTAKKLPL